MGRVEIVKLHLIPHGLEFAIWSSSGFADLLNELFESLIRVASLSSRLSCWISALHALLL